MIFFFFFFQAEDGIRDVAVTGVQTCALPIYRFGNVIRGKAVTLAATGSGNSLVQPGVTDANGVTSGTLASTVAQAKAVSATVGGVGITQTATVTVSPAAA